MEKPIAGQRYRWQNGAEATLLRYEPGGRTWMIHDAKNWPSLMGNRVSVEALACAELVPGPQPSEAPRAWCGGKHSAVVAACSCGYTRQFAPELVPADCVPEKPPVHVIPYPKLPPDFYGLGIGHLLEQGFEQSAPCQCGGKGIAVSALESIQARKKPEPWIESCDPLHWIPDA